jgi:S-adenosylmethionine hydrolase
VKDARKRREKKEIEKIVASLQFGNVFSNCQYSIAVGERESENQWCIQKQRCGDVLAHSSSFFFTKEAKTDQNGLSTR